VSAPRILLVCTANMCRSPMAHQILVARLREYDAIAAVRSSGSLAVGNPATAEAIAAVAQMGLDLSKHQSSVTSMGTLRSADLVITMERRHVRELVELDPTMVWPKTFPLRSLVDRAIAIGERQTEESFSEWVARLHQGRKAAELLVDSRGADIADPIGQPFHVYVDTAKELDRLLSSFVRLGFPLSFENL
jgi:protein-tyrosine phosphatase